jgi:hypothetical protein
MMTITSRTAAWILAAGLVAWAGTPSFAADPSWANTTGIVSSNAQQPVGDVPQVAPNAAGDEAGTTPQADTMDRSLTADQRLPDATAQANDAPVTQVKANDESGGWDNASVVGKIFIAAGTLLTLGSAARMFMI